MKDSLGTIRIHYLGPHSNAYTESNVGYMSDGTEELDTDVKCSLEMKSNRESGYLSCCDSVLMEQNMITKVGDIDCNILIL